MAYGCVAAAAVLATVVLLLAVRATPPMFAAGAVGAVLGLVVAVIALTRTTARCWLARARAAAWVDRTMRLDGRLLTLADLRAGDDAALVAVLERQTTERLSTWTPRQVVPRAVPRGMLTAAIGALAMLATSVVLAPRLRAAPPRIVVGDRPMDWVAASGDDTGTAEEHLLAPGTEHASPGGDDGTHAGADADEPGASQAWLQRELLGDDDPAWDGGDGALASSPRRASTSGTPSRGPAADGDASTAPDRATDDGAPRAAHPTNGDATDGSGDAPNAGAGTDPRLFANAAPDDAAPRDRFELAIAARVRTRHAGPGAPDGDAPAAEPDRHPTLADGGRADDPILRMPVPVAWEPLVRRLYGRRAGVPEMTP